MGNRSTTQCDALPGGCSEFLLPKYALSLSPASRFFAVGFSCGHGGFGTRVFSENPPGSCPHLLRRECPAPEMRGRERWDEGKCH